MVVVLWHDVGRLWGFLFGQCYRGLGGVVCGVVGSFFVVCPVYPSFVSRRLCSCRLERRVNNSVCSCHGYCPHIPILGDVVS